MPYLPNDPDDLGRNHEAIIRVNSRSGKSGVAWLVREMFGIDMPLDLERVFARVVQEYVTAIGTEITPSMIKDHSKETT